MSLWDDFKAGVSELVNAPLSFGKDLTGTAVQVNTLGVTDLGIQGDYTIPPSSGLNHESLNTNSFAGNVQPSRVEPPHNSEFVTGVNLLLSDPSTFFNQLTGGNPADIPTNELNRVATKPVSDNLPSVPTWIKVTAIVGIGIAALVAVSLTLHEVRKA